LLRLAPGMTFAWPVDRTETDRWPFAFRPICCSALRREGGLVKLGRSN
jgi:hypothetical protein